MRATCGIALASRLRTGLGRRRCWWGSLILRRLAHTEVSLLLDPEPGASQTVEAGATNTRKHKQLETQQTAAPQGVTGLSQCDDPEAVLHLGGCVWDGGGGAHGWGRRGGAER